MGLVQLELLAGDEGTPGVALVTLEDPGRRNRMSPDLVAELTGLVRDAGADPGVGALVVTGAPPAFCAGADLGDLAAHGGARRHGSGGGAGTGDAARSDETEAGLRAIYEGFLALARCPLPTVAAVNGAAVGAGMNLALACDVRIAGRSASFDTRFLELGLHPGGGHTFMLERIGGPQLAAALVLFGERLDGTQAAAHGLAWRCVEDDDLVAEAVALARRAASAPRELAVRAKETLRRVAAIDEHAEAVDVEIAAQLWSLGEPFFAERLARLRARVSGGTPLQR